MSIVIGSVLKKLLLSPPETCSSRERQSLHRAFLWDHDMERPSDRLMAISMAGEVGFERGLVMHYSLDPFNSKSIVMDRLESQMKKYSHKDSFAANTGKQINQKSVVSALQRWPKNWRRMLTGDHGGVPVDALIVALVADGFSVPMTWEQISAVGNGFNLSYGGSTSDWPLIWCPA